MKFKYFLLAILIISSFYFTDKVMIYIDSKNPIMEEIVSKEKMYTTKAVNAVIKDNTIIPGINGKKINKKRSLIKMEDFGAFNESFFVYDEIKPKVSIVNNKDKVIIKGNSKKRSVSLIVVSNNTIEAYLNKSNIKYNLLCTLDTKLSNNYECINGEKTKENYLNLESLLKKKKMNNDLCLINYSNLEVCKNEKKYLINYSIQKTNIIDILNNIESGSIILINNISVDNLKLIISEIIKQDLNIVYLSELINEIN